MQNTNFRNLDVGVERKLADGKVGSNSLRPFPLAIKLQVNLT